MRKLSLALLLTLTVLKKAEAENVLKYLSDTTDYATAAVVVDMFQSAQSDLPGFPETQTNIRRAVNTVHQRGG